MTSGDSGIRESTLLLLFAISSFASNIFSNDELSSILLKGLADPSVDVLMMAIKAYCKIALLHYVEKRPNTLRDNTQFCIDHLQEWYNNGYLDVFMLLYQTFSEYILYLEDHQLCSLLAISIAVGD